MSNKSLNKAKQMKDDEFYTHLSDIEEELFLYPSGIFLNKRILCPCDSPEMSFFGKFLNKNFDLFRLRELHISQYIPQGKGRVFSRDIHSSSIKEWQGDGDFRSEELCHLRDRCDIIITNPPFSLFREFFH